MIHRRDRELQRTHDLSWKGGLNSSGVWIRRSSLRAAADMTALGLIFAICFFIFSRGDDGFSYDFRHYLKFFEVLKGAPLSSVFEGFLLDGFVPYISIPGSPLLVEPGFALISWAAAATLGSAEHAYAGIASTSIVVRVLIWRKIGVRWLLVLPLAAYSITLFEANALRLGCASTALMAMVYCLVKGRSPALVITCAIAGAVFHVQTVFLTAFLLPLYYFHKLYGARGLGVLAATVVLVSTAGVALYVSSGLGLTKVSDYSGREAAAAGVNIVSGLAIVILLLAIGSAVFRSRSSFDVAVRDPLQRLWLSVVLSSVPSVFLFATATSLGAIGGRLWQAAFVVIASIGLSGLYSKRIGPGEKGRWAIGLLLLISVLNVLYRYPLSAFFFPLAPMPSVGS